METGLAKAENLLIVNKIKMGFSVEDTINKLKQKDLVTITKLMPSEKEHSGSLFQCLQLFEKNALGSTLLRAASIFDPNLMCDFPKKLQERWKQPLKNLIVLGIVAPN